METNFRDLINVQKGVNLKITERLEEKNMKLPDPSDFLLAMHVEVFEFINEVGVWKWWKHNKEKDKEKILDELADVIAFFLAIIEQTGAYKKEVDNIIGETTMEFEERETIEILQNISVTIDSISQIPFPLLMAICIVVAQNEVGATWEEIEQAYLKKSEVNIERQEEEY